MWPAPLSASCPHPQTLKDERGQISLEHLRQMGDEEAKQQLLRFKGRVGQRRPAGAFSRCLKAMAREAP